ncbi:hypothetical protein CY35_13G071400 [Sphagnum magellanicum]|nr:hypothetical protein CY35_13G071400 [Sphagnum magellanicum]
MWRQAFKNNDALWKRVSCYAPRLELADCRSLHVAVRREHSGSQSDLVSSSGHLTTGHDGVGDRPLRATVMAFQSSKPIEEAVTPPSAWYTSCDFAQLEMERVFARGWQAVGRVNQLEKPGDYFTGRLGNIRYLVCKDEREQIHAFHNVCRHHAAAVASGSGCAHSFVCPYHGWTYGMDGKLQKATRLAGIRNFSARENGLVPIRTATWGPFVLITLEGNKTAHVSTTVGEEWLGSAVSVLSTAGVDTSLHHVATREYLINCNWKVYCDNYLDGGYHVPHAHSALASSLDLSSYSTTVFEKVSIQSCHPVRATGADSDTRVAGPATYAFVYPNFMINRYGSWMDTNLVLPITESQCRVIFDWFLDPSRVDDKEFIETSIEDSERVQIEDITLCEDVQDGLKSPAYDVGRYAPRVEHAMHHFHSLLHNDLSS